LITLKAQIASYNEVFLLASPLMLVGAFTAFMIKVGKQVPKEEIFIE